VAVDSAWNSYMAWNFEWTATFSWLASLTSNGNTDTFIAKLSPSGVYQRVTQWWSAAGDSTNWVAVDSAWNSYIIWSVNQTGTFWWIQFPYWWPFIAKLSPSGVYQRVVRWWSGDNRNQLSSVTVGSDWNAYIAW
jgi:hypothetical protein